MASNLILVTEDIYWIHIDGRKYRITAINWKNVRIYLRMHPSGSQYYEELGYFDVQDEHEDELYTRRIPDEVVAFLEKNRESIIEDLIEQES